MSLFNCGVLCHCILKTNGDVIKICDDDDKAKQITSTQTVHVIELEEGNYYWFLIMIPIFVVIIGLLCFLCYRKRWCVLKMSKKIYSPQTNSYDKCKLWFVNELFMFLLIPMYGTNFFYFKYFRCIWKRTGRRLGGERTVRYRARDQSAHMSDARSDASSSGISTKKKKSTEVFHMSLRGKDAVDDALPKYWTELRRQETHVDTVTLFLYYFSTILVHK